MSFHGSKNVTTAGTEVPLVAGTITLPSQRFCARVTVEAKPANTGFIYVGIGTGLNTVVSSTDYGTRLAAGQSFTVGMGETHCNGTDLASVWIDSSVNGEGVTFFAEQI